MEQVDGSPPPKWEDSPVEIELSNVKIHYY